MDGMILLVSDEIYPLSLSADNAAVGANKDTAFLRRHISQMRAFALFCTKTPDPVARPPRVAAPIPAAGRGFTPFAAKSPVPKSRAEQGSRVLPAALGGSFLSGSRRRGVPVPPGQRRSPCCCGDGAVLRGSSGLGQRHKPDTCSRWSLLWLCPIFKGELSPFSQGSGQSGAAESALRAALAAMLYSPRPIHLLSDFITSPKIQPRFVLRSYRRLREPGTDLWLPIKIMWFHHETWKLWLHFSFGDFWLCSRLGSEGRECESGVCIGAGALGCCQ